MRVIHECAGTARFKFIYICLADRDGDLRQSGNAIHAGRQTLSMPMNRRFFRQFICDEHAHLVAFDHFDRRPRTAAVVAPQVCLHAGCDFAHDRFGNQVEFFPAIFHAPRRAPAV